MKTRGVVPSSLAIQYLCLMHPAWSCWWCFMLPSSVMHHLIIVAWWRLTIYSSINHYGIASLSHIYTCPLSPNGQQDSGICFSKCLSWTCASQPWWWTSFNFILSWAIPNPSLDISPWKHTIRSLDTTWYILYASWLDQLESTILSLSWLTLYLLMLYQISLEIHKDFFYFIACFKSWSIMTQLMRQSWP
jgi:hypothetical protein